MLKIFSFILLSIFLTLSCTQQKTDTIDQSSKISAKASMQDYDFITVSEALMPHVSYALRNENDLVMITVKAESFNNIEPTIKLGISSEKKKVLSSDNAKKKTDASYVLYSFSVLKSEIGEIANEFKMAFEVNWFSKDLNIDLRKERFLHINPAAPHSGLSENEKNWAALNFKDYKQQVSDKRNEINLNINQPLNGKMTVVIENEKGDRIRNLISGVKSTQGKHEIPWDGTDDTGNLVKPGKYTWRSISHPGITPEHQMTIANGNLGKPKAFGTNHGTFIDAVSNDEYAFIAAPLTEGGWAMIAVDEKGKWQKGFQHIHGTPIHSIKVAASNKYFFAFHDGRAWDDKADTTKANWVTNNFISLTRFEINSTQVKNFPGNKKFLRLESYEYGPGAKDTRFKDGYSLAGATFLKGNVYVATKHDNKIHQLDHEKGQITDSISINNPGPLSTDGNRLFVVSGDNILALSPGTKKHETIVKNTGLDIRGMTVSKDGKIYLTDNKSHTVKVYSLQ
ncbi:MAG: hypothetical protein NE328_12050, partial [Lentisphaeraceae bacterium]|nr:hypothetical protein [Lentisphaeraceae bacterium]